MNLAVVGSRDWPDRVFVLTKLLEFARQHNPRDDQEGWLIIVSGGARGVDALARDFAGQNACPLIEHLPDWDRDGRSAGFKRNKLIIADADLVLAFQHNKSRGTQHSIDLADEAGVPVIVFDSGALP